MSETSNIVAVTGLSGRFPGAPDPETFWRNLENGVESISRFSRAELLASGVAPELVDHPEYVPAAAVLEGIEQLDAEFFGLTAREAECTDPQHRVLLECAWTALEQAGYAGVEFDGRAGVFVGGGDSGYWARHLAPHPGLTRTAGALPLLIGNAKDYLATRISYKLGLTGPSLTVSTACSTSLVAVHLACQSLLDFHCDVALAGGVAIEIPTREGYLYLEGGIGSPDGHCRPFDAAARGTVTGSGAGVVVLRRLEDALAAGDSIHALILGSAVNNDGSQKAGFTAPSELGQASVIAEALSVAGVSAESIGAVEAHGTATPLGDPIEVAALTRVFRRSTARTGFCALGSIKGNVGHLDEAAGIAGLIGMIQALRHRVLPPTLHFQTPNPKLELESSPFFVNAGARTWTAAGPRRAGVSSFGIGGTNAHLILEEAPELAPAAPGPRGACLLVLSARSRSALEAARRNLAAHLEAHPQLALDDVAFTLAAGRRAFSERSVGVCRDRAEAIAWLREPLPPAQASAGAPQIVFAFPGQGSQHPGMGLELYRTEPVYREAFDACADVLLADYAFDLKGALALPPEALAQTAVAQPALFAVEYSLATLLLAWGLEPRIMIGHSVGEYVAGTLAGVFSLEDALRLVTARGRLMQTTAPGAMLAVPLSEAECAPLLSLGLAVAAVNAPALTVLSGTPEAVAEAQHALAAQGLAAVTLRTSHAFHSAQMEPILAEFRALLRRTPLQPPRRPFVSNLTGREIKPAQAVDPEYWVRHLREPVRFSAGLASACGAAPAFLVEAGPGQALKSLARRQFPQLRALSALPESAGSALLASLGELWAAGATVHWKRFFEGEKRRRLPLPTYPFERQRYWIEAPAAAPERAVAPPPARAPEPDPVDAWFYAAAWRRVEPLPPAPALSWTVLSDGSALAQSVAEALRRHGSPVRLATGAGHPLDAVANILCFAPAAASAEESLRSFLTVAQAVGASPGPRRFVLVTRQGLSVAPGDSCIPEQGMLAGAWRALECEYPNLACSGVDLDAAAGEADVRTALRCPGAQLAIRGGDILGQHFVPAPLDARPARTIPERSVWLITGGLGSMGLAVAEYLARTARARLVLVSRTGRVAPGKRFPLPGDAATAEDSAVDGDAECSRATADRIRRLEAAGAEVSVIQADVGDASAVAAAVAATQSKIGPIYGIIHTAGELADALIANQSPETIRRVLGPKTAGAMNLAAASSPEVFLLCSSLSAVAPVPGQLAYAAANAWLDAFAAARAAAGHGLTVSIGWGFWQELGLIERSGMNAAQKQAIQAEITERGWENRGVEIFARLLERGGPPQLLVTPVSPVAGAPAEAPRTRALGHPILTGWVEERPGRAVFSGETTAEHCWVVNEHRVGGHAVLPATAYLDLAVTAFRHTRGSGPVELRAVHFLRPMIFAPATPRQIRLVLEAEGAGGVFCVLSRAGAEGWQEHARGEVSPATGDETPRVLRLAAAEESPHREEQAAPAGFEERVRGFAPHWRTLVHAAFSGNEGVAQFFLPSELAGDLPRFALHPALLDVATGFMAFRPEWDECVPFSFERVLVFAPLPVACAGVIRASGSSPRFAGSVTDSAGQELVRIDGYTLRRAAAPAEPPPEENVRLALRAPGELSSLAYALAPRVAPGPGQVEIKVHAAGLNFIEVLYALGMLPNFTGEEATLGQECAGAIVRVGPGVSAFRLGDEVIAYGPACFAHYTTVAESAVAPKPVRLSFAEAATLPAAFATAWRALVQLAQLRRGERVLIHAAAGGVGLAAVQIARLLGAEVFATAGSPEKRRFLAELGVSHLMDSRSLAFVETVRQLTGGEGLDVVLNSLSGAFIPASLGLLRRHGRFVELGKRDIFNNAPLGLGAFSRFISFFALDMGPDAPGFAELWRDLNAHFTAGTLGPLPHRAFPAAEPRPAFEFMAQARHIGKVVLSYEDRAALRPAAPPDAPAAAHRRPDLRTEFTAPSTETERTVAAVWEDLFGFAPIGIKDSFFDLHGDSFAAAQVTSRLAGPVGQKLSLQLILDFPTIEGLAAQIDALRALQDPEALACEEGVI